MNNNTENVFKPIDVMELSENSHVCFDNICTEYSDTDEHDSQNDNKMKYSPLCIKKEKIYSTNVINETNQSSFGSSYYEENSFDLNVKKEAESPFNSSESDNSTEHYNPGAETKYKVVNCNSDKNSPTILKIVDIKTSDMQDSNDSIVLATMKRKSNEQPNINIRRYPCDICGRMFGRTNHVKKHRLTHFKDKPPKVDFHICDVCGKFFDTNKKLKRHKVCHSTEKPYKCDICLKEYARKCTLYIHMRNHANERNFVCDICNARFNQKATLKAHLFIHTDYRPFKCDVCEKGYYVKRELTDHYRVHTKEKPFQCIFCNMSFRKKNMLHKHLFTHTKEMPYACDICYRPFRQRFALKKHQLIHTRKQNESV